MVEDVDPRLRLIPAHAALVTDEAVARWRVERVCLCGCGEKVHQNKTSRLWAMFRRGHERAMAPEGYFRGQHRQTPLARQRISRSTRAHGIDASLIGLLLADYLAENAMTNMEFAVKAGVSKNWLSMVKTGQQKRIRRTSAVKLLKAMNETIPSHLMTPPRP